jgi:hypothetical protein
MTNKTCDKCQHYTPGDDWQGANRPATGSCRLMCNSSAWPQGAAPDNLCASWSRDGFWIGIYVGAKFGCIHWNKETT